MADTIDPRLVRDLAEILRDTDLSEVEVEQGELRIRVVRAAAAAPAPVMYAAPPAAAPAAASLLPAAPTSVPDAPPPAATAGETVASPMVGTVYLSPTPGSEAFVQPGQRVSAGQTLLIIEAMKTMNPIAAPRAGVLLELLVANEQPVEFGEALAIIE